MNEPFNPYQTWLGLPPEIEHPNYYELLGVEPSEIDVDKVAAAADRAMNRVRAIRPGPHASHWARLLDELREAKRCLIDPERRRAYDADLAAASQAPGDSRSADSTVADPSAAPAGSASMLAPPMAVPVGGSTERPALAGFFGLAVQPASQSPPPSRGVVDPMAPFQSPVAVADYVAPPLGSTEPPPNTASAFGSTPQQPSAADPMLPYGAVAADPMAPLAMPAQDDPMAPVAPGVAQPAVSQNPSQNPSPVGIPMGTAVPAPGSPSLATSPAANPVATTSSTARQARKRKKSSTPLVAAMGATLLLVMIAALIFALGPPRKDDQDRKLADAETAGKRSSANASRTPSAVESKANAERPSRDPMPQTESSNPGVPSSESSGTALSSTDETAMGTDDPPSAEPTPPSESTVPTPEPASPPEPMPQPEPAPPAQTPAELATLSEAMITARRALSEQNFEEADEWLAKAEPLAKTAEQQAKWDRLKQLAHYAREFRRVMDNVMEGFEAGAGINVTETTQVGVVEVAEDRIVLRVAGINKPYPRDDLPLGLGRAIADQFFTQDDPVSLVLKGTFVALHKQATEAHLDDVRQWWREADQKGVDVEHLLPVLDDTYDFAADAPSSENP